MEENPNLKKESFEVQSWKSENELLEDTLTAKESLEEEIPSLKVDKLEIKV